MLDRTKLAKSNRRSPPYGFSWPEPLTWFIIGDMLDLESLAAYGFSWPEPLEKSGAARHVIALHFRQREAVRPVGDSTERANGEKKEGRGGYGER